IISAGQPELFVNQAHVANLATETLGLSPKYVNRVEMACSSGGAGVRQAFGILKAGLVDNILVIGLEKMTENLNMATKGLCLVPDTVFESSQGMTAYSGFALFAQAHMKKYGTTREQMAEISVKNHSFGEKNPKAHFYKHRMLPVTKEKVLSSPMLSYPLSRLDASPISDGAAAVLLSRDDKTKIKPEVKVDIVSSAQRVASAFGTTAINDFTKFAPLIQASQEAYSSAKISAKDIDVAETHDCFTIAELLEYEGLGFCKPGEGGKFIEEGLAYPDGEVCVNPSGGLKAKGHPIGATGVAQIVSITEQLKGIASGIQTDNPTLGLTHNLSGFGTNHIVHVLRRMN
ncbi:MAG: thiolase C-terminal domain-containing protein, partial [Candidatus Hodarchaeales archaeon]